MNLNRSSSVEGIYKNKQFTEEESLPTPAKEKSGKDFIAELRLILFFYLFVLKLGKKILDLQKQI